MLTSVSGGAARILDGKQVAKCVLESIGAEYELLKRGARRVPRLDILKCNQDPATAAYIRNKCKAATELGFEFHVHEPRTVEELFATAKRLNEDSRVHAIVTQLPVRLDQPLNPAQIYTLVQPWKDVDGLNPVNMGLLSMLEASPYFYPCTPAAVCALLDAYQVKVKGRTVCIVGRSAIVGRPLYQMMLRRDATPILCHSMTKDLPGLLRQADIVVVAVGQAGFLQAEWIKPGAVVIDVGINERVEMDSAGSSVRKLVGDVDFEGVSKVAGAVSPVPGGVGPLTVAMLMRNVLRAFELNTAAAALEHKS